MSVKIDNIFPAQGKTVFVTGNHFSAGLEYARILANAESKCVIVKRKFDEKSLEVIANTKIFPRIIKADYKEEK